MTTALLLIAEGSEEMEAVITADLLVRAGFELTIASVTGRQVTCSRGIKLVADVDLGDVKHQEFDIVILPGGMPGAQHFADDATLISKIKAQQEKEGWVAAICASPAVVLANNQLLGDHKATCYPEFEAPIKNFVERAVVVDRKLITSRGPGTAIEFALTIIEQLMGDGKRKEVADQILV